MVIEKIENPLGFTKEVASLLTGLGCSNLAQFKKRDIGLVDIKYLSDEDLIVLEVGDEFDYNSFKIMCASMRKKSHIDNTPKPAEIVKILQNEQKQLKLFEIYLKILYKVLAKNKDDFILDKDKNMKASEGLMLACKSVIGKLEGLIEEATIKKSKSKGNNKITYGIIAGGIGVVILVYIFR